MSENLTKEQKILRSMNEKELEKYLQTPKKGQGYSAKSLKVLGLK